jgi:hypothetical protein
MGMDVSGLCPRRRANVSTEFWANHWMDAVEQLSRCGEGFHANVWSWAAILSLCVEAAEADDELAAIDFDRWEYNGGAGLTSQRLCDLLADEIESIIRLAFDLHDDPFTDDPFSEDFVVCVYADGDVLVVRPTDEAVTSARYQARGRHVWAWVAFLRNCGGFAIW